MTNYEAWQASKALADAQAVAAAHDEAATLTDLGFGMWLVSLAGVNRGTITQLTVKSETRFQARLRHINPGQGVLLGEYWELEKAVAAILAEAPPTRGRDPFRDLTKYSTREEMRERTEKLAARRRARRFG